MRAAPAATRPRRTEAAAFACPRRRFLHAAGVASLGVLVGCARLPWQAQAPARVPRVGFLSDGSPTGPGAPWDQAFADGLRERGYVEGQNIQVEWRYLEAKPEQAADLVAELIQLPVDVLVIRGVALLQAATAATDTIPIVMTTSTDPVGTGVLVPSLARPAGNVTGLSTMQAQLSGKRLQLLKESVPTASRVGMFWNPDDPGGVRSWEEATSAASVLGLTLQSLEVRGAEDFDRVAAAGVAERPDALLVSGGTVFLRLGPRMQDFVAQNRLPAMYAVSDPARGRGLMAYSPNFADLHRRAAYYVDRILKGAKPADLPVEQPMLFDFVINLRTAEALGLTIPEKVLIQATEVIR
jgi:putative ABC transport system substrate-binding protein